MARVAALAVVAGLLAPALMSSALEAQISLVPAQHPVYDWLYHQRVLGNIHRFSYEAQPLSRGTITSYLVRLDARRDRLGSHDRELLRQFLQELSPEGMEEAAEQNLFKGEGNVFQRAIRNFKEQKEPHLYAYTDSAYSYAIDVFYGQRYLSAEDGEGTFNTVLVEKGVRGFASFYDHFGLHMEVGNLSAQSDRRGLFFDPLYDKTFSVVEEERGNSNYFEAMTSLEYGVISAHVGHGALRYGAGFGDPLILSQDASKFDWIRLNLDLNVFRYTVLFGNPTADTDDGILILEGDTVSTRLAPKRWLAMHRFEFLPGDRLKIAFTEMVMQSGRSLDLAYVNPVSPIFLSELDNETRDNVMWILEATWRLVPGLEVHGALLVDDASVFGNIFRGRREGECTSEVRDGCNPDRAFDIGATGSLNSGWDVSVGYQRIEPWVYSHFQRLNAFEQRGFGFGNQLGPNSDQVRVQVRKWLPRRAWVRAWLATTRRGLNPVDGNGEVTNNVGGDILLGSRPRASGEIGFLEGADVHKYREIGIEGVIEPWRGIKLSVRYELRDITQGTRLPDRDLFDIRLTIGF